MALKLPKGFTLPTLIEQGGFATVYRARQQSLDRWVAIKIINEHDNEKREKLLKEAKTQAQLRIDGIPQVYDAFERKSQVYIIMQWIFGISLYKMLDLTLTREQRLSLAESFIHTVAELHSNGYAHRDIKPSNVLVTPENKMYLIDFGLTKKVIEGEKSIEGFIKGTPQYMAPELWVSGPNVDLMRADVYALGKVVMKILGGLDWPPVLNACLSEHPLSRPVNAVDVLTQWNEARSFPAPTANWKNVVALHASETLSEKLYETANSLLQEGRDEEAYWLLVECLKENPDLPEAVALMQVFPGRSNKKKKKQRMIITLVSAACLLILIGTVFIGKMLNTTESFTEDTVFQTPDNHSLLIQEESQNQVVKDEKNRLYMRDYSPTPNFLSANLVIASFPEKGKLFINDEEEPLSRDKVNNVSLPNGQYTLVWKNREDIVEWRERVSLLPFQTKALSIIRKE